MQSDTQVAASRGWSLAGTRFFTSGVLAVLAVVASTELHEWFHWLAGRLAGLPARFLDLTSVGVTPEVAANAPPSALALMNGVAPIATMLLGVLALVAAPRLRRTLPGSVTDFTVWCAIFAIPYIGLQTMLTAAPIELRGNGADFAAVIGGYGRVSTAPRVVISVAGLMLFIASGFWLRAAVSERPEAGRPRVDLGQRLRALAAWRLVAASILGLLLIAVTVRGAAYLAHGSSRGIALLVRGPVVWAAMMALLVRWRAPGAREVRDHWIFPGLLASAVLLLFGFLSHLADYFVLGLLLVLPLVTTAWSESAGGEIGIR